MVVSTRGGAGAAPDSKVPRSPSRNTAISPQPICASHNAVTVARTLGEFGAVLMVSANLPGQSQTLTLLVHDRYLLGNSYGAYTISVVLMAVALIVLVAQILFDAQRSRVKTDD